MFAPGTGRTPTARLWTCARDERPRGGTAPLAAWYRFSGDRRGQHPNDHLARVHGWMHADGHAGPTDLYRSGAHENRWQAETRQRAERLPKGFSGIWHRLTGRYAKARAQDEHEALETLHRDRAEKDALIFKHIVERQAVQRDIRVPREAAQEELPRLREDVAHYMRDDRHDPDHTPTRKREKIREEEGRKRERTPRPHRRRGFEP